MWTFILSMKHDVMYELSMIINMWPPDFKNGNRQKCQVLTLSGKVRNVYKDSSHIFETSSEALEWIDEYQ